MFNVKKAAAVLLAASSLATFPVASAATNGYPCNSYWCLGIRSGTATITGNGVRCRSVPDTSDDNNILGYLYKGDSVEVYTGVNSDRLGYSMEDWTHIHSPYKGFVSSDYVTPEAADPRAVDSGDEIMGFMQIIEAM